jgi:hypothetical protein
MRRRFAADYLRLECDGKWFFAKCDIAQVKHAIQLVGGMTIRVGAIAVALLAALATIKFFA